MNSSSAETTDKLPDDQEAELKARPEEVAITDVDPDQLKKDAEARAEERPVIQRLVEKIRKEKRSYREVIINSEPLERRVAVLNEGVLEKFELERAGDDRLVGAIFKGKIQNLEPGLKAAFVEIGQPKNAFLHYWDILPQADSSVEFIRDTRSDDQKEKKSKVTLKDIPKLYPIGSEIVVQITKSTIGTKGPRTTTNLAIPGRFLVLMPFEGQCGVSRKIEDDKERKRLKDILKKLSIPEGMGVIIRTAGEGKRWTYFVRDLTILLNQWAEIKQRIDKAKQPACVYTEPDIIERTVRDFLTEDIDRVLVDDQEGGDRMIELVARISKRSSGKIAVFKENIPIFERFNIERQIEQTFLRKVALPSGGEIVIEETEALVAVDVNTGAHKNKSDNSNFILDVNLEAATEIARQIKLRNIGGLIILDFIDMKNRNDRSSVFRRMKQEMDRDRAKNHVLPISQLGIMQMTRQRHKESVSSGLYSSCPYCGGRGTVKSSRTMSVEIQRRLTSVIRRLNSPADKPAEPTWLRVFCHPHALERLRHEDEAVLVEIEETYGVKLSFRADPTYHVENFKIVEAGTGQELR
jgi:ribonuclease G|tara:strand:+ start:2778 stop:4517 length:1740 start_codon:yes stop_codon:yes gene_type:complete